MFSIPKEFGGNGRWIVVAVGAFGASTLFERLSDRALGSLGVNVSASEFLVEPLLHGSTFVMLATVLELVVFAPLGEELLFRGVLFGALTSKLTTHRAALLSGVLFAVWHGYGIAGTVVVGFDGYLLARLYARTGSLLPGMLAHGLLNAAVSLYSLGCRF